MGFLERMLGNLIGGHHGGYRGGHHGGSRHGGFGGDPGYPQGTVGALGVIQAIRRAQAQAAAMRAIPAQSAAAPMRTMRASAGNAALPWRPPNVPVAARNSQPMPGSAASAANSGSNAAHIPLWIV